MDTINNPSIQINTNLVCVITFLPNSLLNRAWLGGWVDPRKKKDKSLRQNEKEFDNYKESNTTCIGPLVDCNYQPKLVDGDG